MIRKKKNPLGFQEKRSELHQTLGQFGTIEYNAKETDSDVYISNETCYMMLSDVSEQHMSYFGPIEQIYKSRIIFFL